MSDRIHATVAEALNDVAESYLWVDGADHPAVADFLARLKAKRIELVELPEPSYVDDPEDDGQKGYGFNSSDARLSEHGVYAYDGQVFDQYDGWSPVDARTIAGWWLGAADAAEVTQ